jgi:hypothetical protein
MPLPLSDMQLALKGNLCHPWTLGTTEMAGAIFELNGFLEDDMGRRPLYVLISAPSLVHGERDYACRVHAPSILGEDKYIYGVDSGQAAALAVQFVSSFLNGKNVTDASGQPIHW